MAKIRKVLPGAHCASRAGTGQQARDYCTEGKGGKANEGEVLFPGIEFGAMFVSQQGKRSDVDEVKEKIQNGASRKEIADNHFGTWMRNHRAIDRYIEMCSADRDETERTQVILVWGEAGVGKTRWARESLGEDCWVTPTGFEGKWFDGYEGQLGALFDDFKFTKMDYKDLLRVWDRYKCDVPIKGGFVKWRAKRIISTTTHSPDFWYGEATEMFRRVSLVVHMDPKYAPNPEYGDRCVKVWDKEFGGYKLNY